MFLIITVEIKINNFIERHGYFYDLFFVNIKRNSGVSAIIVPFTIQATVTFAANVCIGLVAKILSKHKLTCEYLHFRFIIELA
jgi:hypothetical protein